MKCDNCGKVERMDDGDGDARMHWAFIRFENANVRLCGNCAYDPIGPLLVKLGIEQMVPKTIAERVDTSRAVPICASCNDSFEVEAKFNILSINNLEAPYSFVAPGATVNVTLRPQVGCRIIRLILEDDTAEAFNVNFIRIGNKIVAPLNSSNPIPAMAFDRSKVSESPTWFEPCYAGQDIVIEAENRYASNEHFRGFFIIKEWNGAY